MKIRKRNFRNLLVFTVLSIAIVASIKELSADDTRTNAKAPFEAATLIIEFNASAEDAGVQLFLDAENWKTVQVFDPNGNKIFEVNGVGKLRKLGMTELFFESVEPSLDEVPLQQFLAKFPEGEYKFVGRTVEGETLISNVPFTHNIPDGPSITSPKKRAVVNPQKTVIRWDPVVTPSGIQIVSYQVIVEREHPHREFSVFLPATVTSIKVPPEFLQSDTKYIFEVLAIEKGRNQTISEGSFRTN